MPNWFENNAAKSVIVYTLVISGATWATSRFVLEENRLNLAREELESQKAVAEQYRTKAELLERDNALMRAENQEYLAWLSKWPEALPAIQPRLTELKERVATLESTLEQRGGNAQPAETVIRGTARLGVAFIERLTGLVVTLNDVTINRTGTVLVKLPGQPEPREEPVFAGKQWSFDLAGARYRLTATEVNWFGDYVNFELEALK